MRRGTMKIMIARKKVRGRKRLERQKLAERQAQQSGRLLEENKGAKVQINLSNN
jgi:hypothetical protein